MSFSPDTRCECEMRAAVNFGERVGDQPIDILLLHYTGMESGEGAVDWLCCEESGVSCHYLVHEDGRIVQMVPEAMRAWHAGNSSWQGITDTNSRSIGIEIVNPGHGENFRDFPDAQIAAVMELSKDIVVRNAIQPRNVLGHSDVAPGRKIDPGERFPWERLWQAGIGHWTRPIAGDDSLELKCGDEGEPVAALQALLAFYGYGVEISGQFDQVTHNCVYAFQQHFRQRLTDGVADGETIATLDGLIAKLNLE